MPGHFTKDDSGTFLLDEEIPDERYVACKIRGRGVVVFSACSHAGIVNVCRDVMKESSAELTAVIGGFHLAGSSVDGRIAETVQDLQKIGPDIILAGHCTGWRAKLELAQAFPFSFQPLSVGGKYTFNSM